MKDEFSEEVFFSHSISELVQLAEELDADFEDVAGHQN